MIYIETGSTDVYFNFGAEYYFTVEKPLDENAFLFWRTTPTLMLGKYQNSLEEIDRAYAEEHGINVVRRLSGEDVPFQPFETESFFTRLKKLFRH